MQISQSALFYLCAASFLVGLALALLYDFLYMMRLWLIPSEVRYHIPRIQELRASRIKKGSAKKHKWGSVVLFLQDVLFCLVCAITVILLLYWLNNGAFRAAAPICMAVGFWLWHISLSKGVRVALEWLAFGIETVIYALLMPIKRLFAFLAGMCKRIAQKRHQKRLANKRKIYTKQTVHNFEKAVQMLLPTYTISRTQKGDGRAKQNKKAV
ncbi:MAG: spore cortex biosynthesis protein YabQ [Clostridia bacterium]|nr:spore cortex biosynthesis protein YabQ [Clostridia bacterium]